jgi:prevent-host-death family protein
VGDSTSSVTLDRHPISVLAKNAKVLVDRARDQKKPIVITHGGRDVAVLIPIELYRKLERQIVRQIASPRLVNPEVEKRLRYGSGDPRSPVGPVGCRPVRRKTSSFLGRSRGAPAEAGTRGVAGSPSPDRHRRRRVWHKQFVAQAVIANIYPSDRTPEARKLSELRLQVELVPASLWRKSLAQMAKAPWDRLRKETYQTTNRHCAICGAECSAPGSLICHEVWDYNDRTLVATLTGLRPICVRCDRVTHWGLTRELVAAGRLPESELDLVIEHFCSVNKCDRPAFERHAQEAFDLHEM